MEPMLGPGDQVIPLCIPQYKLYKEVIPDKTTKLGCGQQLLTIGLCHIF